MFDTEDKGIRTSAAVVQQNPKQNQMGYETCRPENAIGSFILCILSPHTKHQAQSLSMQTGPHADGG